MTTHHLRAKSQAHLKSRDKHHKIYPSPESKRVVADVSETDIRQSREYEPFQSGSLEPLLLKTKDVCRLLGDVNERTLARLEERGFIRRVPLVRHKLYRYQDVIKMVEDLHSWKP